MRATSHRFRHSASTRSPRGWTFLVGCNADFIISDRKFLSFSNKMNLISFENSLHAGVSTTVFLRQAIPQSAFEDAVKDYVADPETDDEGDMYEA